jgi:FkbM family methyltransferase
MFLYWSTITWVPYFLRLVHCILKIDVEGAELEVLKTFSEWIARCQPLVLVEILPGIQQK